MQKPYLLSVNKTDVYTPSLIEKIKKYFAKQGENDVLFYSGATSEGIEQLRTLLFAKVQQFKATESEEAGKEGVV